MYIENCEAESVRRDEERSCLVVRHGGSEVSEAKRALIIVGARFLFYPTLLYNLIRNKIQSEFRWWDFVDEFVLLGAVPFPTDVPQLERIGVRGVVTLNEPYETLVPSSLYHAHDIDHLVIPTRDYLFAPSFGDICLAVDFIHKKASCGKITYVHCKAGRGRSTTIVLCYLMQHKKMSPTAAYEYVKSIRPRVLLASSQWQAVQEYYHLRVKNEKPSCWLDGQVAKALTFNSAQNPVVFDNSSVVVVTESDLDGYDGSEKSGVVGNDIWTEVSWVYRVQFVGQAALARISCLWVQCVARRERGAEKLAGEHLTVEDEQMGTGQVDIPVYVLTAVVKCADHD